eukprot:TRINITY_DN893_c0_g1_i1.p2 TRINITY_DN893_c0_g1~~TRINITY_DN893_c0_g1_i1.p2  ORF type:complete len:333 (+),score=95.90 TRINITY_DN893_c0_g1_i1:89-1000(+)
MEAFEEFLLDVESEDMYPGYLPPAAASGSSQPPAAAAAAGGAAAAAAAAGPAPADEGLDGAAAPLKRSGDPMGGAAKRIALPRRQALPENVFASGNVLPEDLAAQVSGFCGGWLGELRTKSDSAFGSWVQRMVESVQTARAERLAAMDEQQNLSGVHLVWKDLHAFRKDDACRALADALGEGVVVGESRGRMLIAILHAEAVAERFARDAQRRADGGGTWLNECYRIGTESVRLPEGHAATAAATPLRRAFHGRAAGRRNVVSIAELLGPVFVRLAKARFSELGCDGIEVKTEGAHVRIRASW